MRVGGVRMGGVRVGGMRVDGAGTAGTADAAVRAAVAAARRHGLTCTDPTLLRDAGANLVVHLRPAPVVAKVAWLTAQVRADPGRTLGLERELAAWCVDHGGSVRGPAPRLGGVHQQDGFAITFWQYLPDASPVQDDAAVLGGGLAALHEVLATFPGPLPGPEWIAADAHRIALLLSRWGLLPATALTVVQEDLLDVVQQLRDVTRARLESRRPGSVQPLHGDPHGRNATRTPDGVVLWFDLEDAWFGPVEFDLVVASRTAGMDGAVPDGAGPDGTVPDGAVPDGAVPDGAVLVAAYVAAGGQVPDPEVMALCARLRDLEVVCWSLLLGASRPDRWPQAVAALHAYRDAR